MAISMAEANDLMLGTPLEKENSTIGDDPALILSIPLKWRYVTTTAASPSGEATNYGAKSMPSWPLWGSIGSTEISAWHYGGVAIAQNGFCRVGNGSAYFFRHVFGQGYGASGRMSPPWDYWFIQPTHALIQTAKTIEIGWGDALQAVRDAGFDSENYEIEGIRFQNEEGVITDDLVKETYLNLNEINGMYATPNISEVDSNRNLFNMGAVFSYTESTMAVPSGDPEVADIIVDTSAVTNMSLESMNGYDNNSQWTEDVKALNSCKEEADRPVNMTAKIYLKLKTRIYGGSGWSPPEIVIDITPDPIEPRGSGVITNGGGSGGGSINEGLNSVYSKYGNSKLPFDSIYLTGDNFNQFLSAGGGIITNGLGGLDNSGIFPNSATMYIDQIRVDVEGSSMTIIEAVDFDATPSLDLTTKVYGYVLDSGGNQTKPSFVGYVTSRKRRLSSGRSEIVYECKDLIHFLNQFYTQSHYIYRPPSYEGQGSSKTYDRIIKEVLNVAGIPTALINLPSTVAPPVRWIYQTVRTVLEWAGKYFGKYVYFVDRYGRLNFKATDSGSFIKNFTIPTKGDSIGSNRVSDFSPITDFSRSRSQVVLTGDFPIKDNILIASYGRGGKLDPNLCRTTGFYWFDTVVDGKTYKFYYFKFVPNQTLNPQLLSDPSVSAKVSLVQPGNHRVIEELSIRGFKSEPGDSEIYVESPEFARYRNITLKIEYATRGNSPIQVVTQTGLFGGTEIVRRPEFKKAESLVDNIDDTPIMEQYLNKIKDFYKPVYGGSLTLEYLDTDLELLGKVSVQNTSLPAEEADNLICYSITYDIPNKRTIVDLSNKVYGDLAFFDIIRETSRENSELRAKLGLIEETQLYYRK